MSIHGVSCIPLSFKEGGGYSPPSPSPKSATDISGPEEAIIGQANSGQIFEYVGKGHAPIDILLHNQHAKLIPRGLGHAPQENLKKQML